MSKAVLRPTTRASTAAASSASLVPSNAENQAPLGGADEAAGKHVSMRRGLTDISNAARIAAGVQAPGKRAPAVKATERTASTGSLGSLAPLGLGAGLPSAHAHAQAQQHAVVRLEECDQAVLRDPRYATEYVASIYAHFLSTEQKWLVSPSYMTGQSDITPRMRAILCDWLVEVHQKFKLLPQTLYIAINILDRYLEQVVTLRDELQLVGCCCLWMASKFEEIYAPEPQDFVLISDRAFKRQDMLAMEGRILNVLEFRLAAPTHYTFLTRFAFVAGASKRQKYLALYCVERTLQEYSFLRFKPSLVAGAALSVALEATGCARWSLALERVTGYSEPTLKQCALEIRDLIKDAEHRSLLAVRKKYLLEEYEQVAKISVLPSSDSLAPGDM